MGTATVGNAAQRQGKAKSHDTARTVLKIYRYETGIWWFFDSFWSGMVWWYLLEITVNSFFTVISHMYFDFPGKSGMHTTFV